jgi:hypothetical protein
LIDHVDFRVGDLPAARRVIDPLMQALGQGVASEEGGCVCYCRERRGASFFSLVLDAEHRVNRSRVAFCARSRDEVDRLAEVVRSAGAQRLEGPRFCREYSDRYYAAFFEDTEGNRYEICCRI